jgi:hypothetical protein
MDEDPRCRGIAVLKTGPAYVADFYPPPRRNPQA